MSSPVEREDLTEISNNFRRRWTSQARNTALHRINTRLNRLRQEQFWEELNQEDGDTIVEIVDSEISFRRSRSTFYSGDPNKLRIGRVCSGNNTVTDTEQTNEVSGITNNLQRSVDLSLDLQPIITQFNDNLRRNHNANFGVFGTVAPQVIPPVGFQITIETEVIRTIHIEDTITVDELIIGLNRLIQELFKEDNTEANRVTLTLIHPTKRETNTELKALAQTQENSAEGQDIQFLRLFRPVHQNIYNLKSTDLNTQEGKCDSTTAQSTTIPAPPPLPKVTPLFVNTVKHKNSEKTTQTKRQVSAEEFNFTPLQSPEAQNTEGFGFGQIDLNLDSQTREKVPFASLRNTRLRRSISNLELESQPSYYQSTVSSGRSTPDSVGLEFDNYSHLLQLSPSRESRGVNTVDPVHHNNSVFTPSRGVTENCGARRVLNFDQSVHCQTDITSILGDSFTINTPSKAFIQRQISERETVKQTGLGKSASTQTNSESKSEVQVPQKSASQTQTRRTVDNQSQTAENSQKTNKDLAKKTDSASQATEQKTKMATGEESRVILTKPPHSKFDGSIDSNHIEYMNSFLNFCNSLNYTEKQKCQEFIASMVGQAASKINSLPPEVKSDWEALRKSFNEFCASPARKSIWSAKFERIKFDPKKGIDPYIKEVQALGEMLGLEESSIASHMVNKLNKPLYTALLPLGLVTLEDTISKIRLLYMGGVGTQESTEPTPTIEVNKSNATSDKIMQGLVQAQEN